MASLFDKARTLVLGNLHDLLDRAIDLNSMAAVRQYVRDLESAKDEVADSAAVAKATYKDLDKQVHDLHDQIVATDANVKEVLAAGNEALAQKQMKKQMGLEAQMKDVSEQLETAHQTADALAMAASKIAGKYAEMLGQVTRLEQQQKAAVAKEKAAKALSGAAKLSSTGAGAQASVDNVAARIRKQSAVADSRFDRAMQDINDGDGADADMADFEAKKRLDALRAQMAGGAAAKTAP